MTTVFSNRTARAVVVNESGSARQMLSDAVRNLGILDLVVLSSTQDLLGFLEVEECDWLIMPLATQSPVTAVHILEIVANTPRLKNIRSSIMFDAQDDVYLPACFQLGLMSCHPKSYLRDDVIKEFQLLMECLKVNAWNSTLVAGEYLRKHLNSNKQYAAVLTLEQSLLQVFPGSVTLLMKLGEALLLNDKADEGMKALQQSTILDERCKPIAEMICQKILGRRIGNPQNSASSSANILGIQVCVVVDPDTAVLSATKDLLQTVGVPHVFTFEDGDAAWEWLSSNSEPDLIIMEWRIPGLPGPMLLQRIRDQGFYKVPIIVISSVIKPKEVHLLREMGVDEVIAKPYGSQVFFKSVIWTLQQSLSPTEQESLERKLRRLLQAGNTEEAERLKAIYFADKRIPTPGKKTVEAEFAFHHGKFREARDLGIEALKLSGDSLRLLNLIGKSLIRLNDNASALKFFDKAHLLSPLNLEHLCNLAVCQLEAGDLNAAEDTIGKAAKLDSTSTKVEDTQCQIAIIGGKSGRAKELMNRLSSVTRVVGYMNNRAVALSRCGRYEDGIKLYRQTMESLPDSSNDTKNTVAYNLALAFAKYGDLAAASEELQVILKFPNSPIHKKSVSLESRLKTAIEKGTALTFSEASLSLETDSPQPGEQSVKTEIKSYGNLTVFNVASVIEIQRGDLCLFRIFDDPESKEVASKLRENPPRFVERSAIQRSETLTRKNN